MKAWVVREDGNPWEVFRQEDFPEPTAAALGGYAISIEGLRELRPGETPIRDWTIMRVKVAALAWPDVTMATGEYPVRVPKPYVSGQEAVGVVEEASPSMQRYLGKRVVAFTPQPWGSFAPRCVAGPQVFEPPESFSDEEAAAFYIPAHTAYHAVHRRGRLAAGESVLILGAAGGVPSAAVQLAVAAGARVIAVCGGAEKVDFCRKLGAQVVIDHRAEDFVAAVRRETDGRGVDMIVDFVQGEPGRRARPLLVVEGRHVMAGHAGGLLPVHPNEFYLQNWTLIGCCMGSGYENSSELEEQTHRAVVDLVEQGRYRPLVGRSVGFDEIPQAFHDLVDRKVMGRIVAHIGG